MSTTEQLYKKYKDNFSSYKYNIFPFKFRKRKPKITDFIIRKELGSGYSGTVHLASLTRDPSFNLAIKIMDKDDDHAKTEVKFLQLAQSDHVVKLYDYFRDNSRLYLILEYCPNGDLYDKIYKDNYIIESEAKPIVRDICYGIKSCHDRHIVHGDIKKENVILFDDRAKLVDFGLSFNNNYDGNVIGGTYNYIAPEIAHNLWNLCGSEVDIWSLGVLIFEMLTGFSPFVTDCNKAATIKNIMLCKYKIPRFLSYSARDLIESMLQISPSLRPTIDEVLAHEWLN